MPSTVLQEGRIATIVGIVRRPYPTATDRRFAVVARSAADVAIGPPNRDGSSAASATTGATGRGSAGRRAGAAASRSTSAGPAGAPEVAAPLDVDLGLLADHVGAIVRVGGLVSAVEPDGLVVDDGTAEGRIALTGEAGAYLPLLEPDDALNAVGRVVLREGRPIVEVSDPAGLLRVGNLGEPVSLEPSASVADRAAGAPEAGPAEPALAADDAAAARQTSLSVAAGGGTTELPMPGGLVVLAVVLALAVALATVRRRRLEQDLGRRVAARLAAFRRPERGAAR